jgi:hypothetical protein
MQSIESLQPRRLAVVAAVGMTIWAGSAVGQPLGARQQPQPPKKERLWPPLSGTIRQIVPTRQLLVLETAERQPWLVQVTRTTTATVEGEVGPEFLRPGLTVRFYGRLARRTRAVEPIDEVVVVTPDATFRPGVREVSEEEKASDREPSLATAASDGQTQASEGAEEDEEGPLEEAQEAEPDPKATPRKTARGGKQQQLPAQRYWISGQLRSLKRGMMVVQAGKAKVRAEVNEATRVVVEAKDLRLARPGDKAVVHGSKYIVGQAEASKIEVTLAGRPSPEREE